MNANPIVVLSRKIRSQPEVRKGSALRLKSPKSFLDRVSTGCDSAQISAKLREIPVFPSTRQSIREQTIATSSGTSVARTQMS
jgi:hypothetical protein